MSKFINHNKNHYFNPEAIAYFRHDPHNDKLHLTIPGHAQPVIVSNAEEMLRRLGLLETASDEPEPRPNVAKLSAEDYDLLEGAPSKELPEEAFDDFLSSTKE